jgi:hypothetical protein
MGAMWRKGSRASRLWRPPGSCERPWECGSESRLRCSQIICVDRTDMAARKTKDLPRRSQPCFQPGLDSFPLLRLDHFQFSMGTMTEAIWHSSFPTTNVVVSGLTDCSGRPLSVISSSFARRNEQISTYFIFVGPLRYWIEQNLISTSCAHNSYST